MMRMLTCIVCPRGCQLTANVQGGEVLNVEGYTCKRGREYAIAECTHPVRTVTSTVRTSDGGVIPVKTSAAIPKEKIMECMAVINAATVQLPAKIGDVVVKNILGTGADLIVTANMGLEGLASFAQSENGLA